MIKSGKVSINPVEWANKSKDEFFAAVKGKLTHDKEDIWNQICKINGKDESTCEFGKSVKKHYGKRASSSTESE